MKSDSHIRNLAYISFIMIAVLCVMFIWISDTTVKNEFENGNSNRVAGLINKGWLPAWFPPAARNIKMSHNLDSNYVELSFEYTGADLTTLGACERTSFTREYVDKHRIAEVLSGDILPRGLYHHLASGEWPLFSCKWNDATTTLCLTRATDNRYYMWRPYNSY